MARIFIIDREDQSGVPFLRGILTRSLQNAGLGFDEAYRIASEVRSELIGHKEEELRLSPEELRAHVLQHLTPLGDEFVERYSGTNLQPTVLVDYPEGHSLPYSRGRYAQSLRAAGLTSEEAAMIATLSYKALKSRHINRISRQNLRKQTHRLLTEHVGPEAAQRYLIWRQFQAQDRPLLLLIGGIAGSGKSTVAAQLAHVLEIVRTQSTDMLREVMRVTMPEGLLPVLHTSSFRAGEALSRPFQATEDPSRIIAEGFLSQMELVSVGCEAAVSRATREQVSLILEGVHIHPTLIARLRNQTNAVVVPIMLAALKKSGLRARIKGRAEDTPERRAKQYLSNFDSLWSLQSFLLDEADKASVPIVVNEDLEDTVRQSILSLLQTLALEYSGDPAELLGD